LDFGRSGTLSRCLGPSCRRGWVKDGLRLHRLAAGEDDSPLQPTTPPVEIRESIDLDEPEHNLEPLLFLLRGLADRMMARLKAMSLACAAILPSSLLAKAAGRAACRGQGGDADS
jgi:hypothetical protein